MYFPWVGMFEQIRLADKYVDYSDVAFSKGSFTNRVQVKSANGILWLTIPISLKFGDSICDILVDEQQNWRKKHRNTFAQAYAKAHYINDALEIIDEVFDVSGSSLRDISSNSMRLIHKYFEFDKPAQWYDIRELNIAGLGSDRVLSVVKKLGCATYVSGRGGLNYLNHSQFDDCGVEIKYLDYQCLTYPQLHGVFTPYVSALDLVANCGKEGRKYISSPAVNWKDFMHEQHN
jgi:hypothetical protein